MADLLIGLDVGTTATKALLFDIKGRLLAEASRGYGLLTPHPGWVEQDPEEIWRAVLETLRSLGGACAQGDRVLALAQSSQGGTTIPAAADGLPVYPALSWMDQRAAEEAARLQETWDAESIRVLTGWPLGLGLPLLHAAWLRDRRPVEFAAASRFMFVNDFVGFRLTGVPVMNPADASITQLMNLATGDWDDRLLDWAGITRGKMSPMRPSAAPIGRLTREAADATGLSQDTLLINGAHDQYCAAVGTGVTHPGRMLLSCGTAWVLLAVPGDLETGLSSGMGISRHAVEGRYGAIRSLGAVGASLEWLLDQVWRGTGPEEARDRLYAVVNDAAARVGPGSAGLVFLPLAGGHAAGFGASNGGFLNLSLSHTRDHMTRAVMEGTVCELRWAVEKIREKGIAVSELTMVGGAAKSPVWPQIVANILDVPVIIPALRDAAARGAAMLAGVGAGCFPDSETAFAAWQGNEARLEPDQAARPVCEEIYRVYRQAAEQQIARA